MATPPLADWLRDHGLNMTDLEPWGVTATPEGELHIPITSYTGKSLYTLQRRFTKQPKYIPDPVDARAAVTLYGLGMAMPHIMLAKAAIVVEGFSDVIACHKHTYPNTVGLVRSYISPAQAAVLSAVAESIYFWLDGDDAGTAQAKEVWRMFPDRKVIGIGIYHRLAKRGLDPAEFLAHGGQMPMLMERAFELRCAGMVYAMFDATDGMLLEGKTKHNA